MSYQYIYKFIIIGDSAVGKSCTLLQFLDATYRENHEITIGVEFGAKCIDVKDQSVKLQIWDTAGQESFKSITRSYYRSAAGALLVYDITRRETFEHIEDWLSECRENGNGEMTIVLVGNKSDLENERQVSYEEGLALAQSKNILFIESSAKNAVNVDEAFQAAADIICDKVTCGKIDLDDDSYGVKVVNHQFVDTRLKNKEKPGEVKEGCC